MSGMLNGFDWNGETSQPSEGMTPLPVGVYYFTVAEANEKITKAGTGQYLELQFECLDDEHKGRKVYATFNLVNKNSQAVQIAQKEFRSFGQACGKQFTSAQEIPGHVLKLRIRHEPHYKDEGRMVARVAEFLPSGQAPPVPGLQQPVQTNAAEQPAAAGDDTPF